MKLSTPVSARDHVRGNPQAPVVLVEFGDFECPHSGSAHGVLHVLQDELGDRVALVYRHFPLQDVHPFAGIAAEAAEAAASQGRFWEMHDVMFANQDALQPDDLMAYADVLGLDTDRFIGELTGRVHRARVQEDVAGGVRSGVHGTPAFFVNGERYGGGRDLQSLLEAVNRADYARR